MTAVKVAAAPTVGLFDRVSDLFAVIDMLPDTMSDEEITGLMKVLPPDSSHSLTAMLKPHVREGSLAFMKMLAGWLQQAKDAPGQGKKAVLVPFNFPPELIHAFDNGYPITSELLSTLGVVALEGRGERYWDMARGLGLPDHICSSNSIELGSMLASDDFRPQALVSSAAGACDIIAKIHEFVSHYHSIPQFLLEKPVDDSERGREQFQKNYMLLVGRLEEFFGEELTYEKLLPVAEKSNRCTELFLDLWDLHKAAPCPVPNLFALYTYGARFSMWGTDEGVTCMETMVDVSKRRLAAGEYPAEREVARCLLVYTSYYFDLANLFNWMESKGYSYLTDGLGLLFPQPIDTSSRESILRGLAIEAINMPMTRQVGGESMSMSWLEDALYVAKELNADCAIYSGHHSCKQTWSVLSILRTEMMKRAGVPLLALEGDSWLARMTPMSAIQQRIDEFVTNVVASKTETTRRKVGRKKREEA